MLSPHRSPQSPLTANQLQRAHVHTVILDLDLTTMVSLVFVVSVSS